MRSSGFILALSLCVGGLSPSSARAVGNAEFITRLWELEDGLPHNNVEAVAQTRDGYLWVGTRDGLSHLRPCRFRTSSAVDGLAHNHAVGLSFADGHAEIKRWEDAPFLTRNPTGRGQVPSSQTLYG